MTRSQQRRSLGYVLLLATATGCPQCAPQDVGEGVAKLTVRNVGAVVSLVNANTDCGFASPAVQSAGVVEGTPGSAGSLTFTVTDCVIDLGTQGTAFPQDCNGNANRAFGKVTVSGTRRVDGVVTGQAQAPVAPTSPDALTITLTNARFENFEVENPNSENLLMILDGSLSAVAKPRLAVAEASGVCSVATPNVAFSDIVYTDANLHLTTPDNSFDVPVATSDLAAQNGVREGEENVVSGGITVFDNAVTLETELDPDYDPTVFVASYSCNPELAQPISFDCSP